ncbi:MAG: TraR/DksA C4-type zinc finger protein [Alysiella sp.]|uniref:TraR/DksA C4-type zinc finger protein n=1 Tax=Alysiella sp. TaxID=1872483 RepID=UPI0026DD3DF1|nr:TraR/DksA C4-type zinc finger protein [Alysiella sp.]MDO4434732.1 TraR/DksA C4-type zinc finger protein [Alysiella sp.]
MSDLIDQANEAAERFQAVALNRIRLPEDKTRYSYSHCMDCGEPIPQARQKAVAGCKLCVLCQEDAEKRKALQGL